MTLGYTQEAAFAALREALQKPELAQGFTCEEVPFERLRRAIFDTDLGPLDRAIRLRHALRYADCKLTLGSIRHAFPFVSDPRWPNAQQCFDVGLVMRAGGFVEARPWFPDWVGQGGVAVDARAMEQPTRTGIQSPPATDRWVQEQFGHSSYRGPGQALAVRASLNMPPGQSLLALLPTGEGKSLVFQALAAAHPDKVVAVVVPTVALALDQDNSARKLGELLGTHTHAYLGGQDLQNAEILERITNGRQGLVFAAPEAFGGRLQPALMKAAASGKLAALVIDEAHLVDAWGTDFRNDFQLLAALAAELRLRAPPRLAPRLICLSATVTQGAFDALKNLFSPHMRLAVVSGSRLRPEPDIWVAPMAPDEETRRTRVLEALLHLPRPAILYVTKVDDARAWYWRLKAAGLRRVRVLHGESSAVDREATLNDWRTGDLDLVIGTSAFGLGIDYSHVRTVVHACIPESLDRYYQEVGRSGRDGHASIALIAPVPGDYQVAESVARQKVISVEKGLSRWASMFGHSERDAEINGAIPRFFVDTSIAPRYNIDLMGERHEDWNGRTLSLMARAGLIAFSGLRFNAEKSRSEIAVDILDDGHLDPDLWSARVEPIRQKFLRSGFDRLSDLKEMLSESTCPSLRLKKLYTLTTGTRVLPVAAACGGCTSCRICLESGWFADWAETPEAPWTVGTLSARLLSHMEGGRVVIERENETFDRPVDRRLLIEFVNGLWDHGLRKCIAVGAIPDALEWALAKRPWCTAQGDNANLLSSSGLPPGPAVIWVSINTTIPEHQFFPRKTGDERLFLIPAGLPNPDRLGRLISDQFPTANFNSLYESLQT
jgi:ATP-dependent DNA helicase RecQ